jgi:hypothetical protein
MKISERDEFLNENPHIQPMLSAPAIIGGTGSDQKVPEGFKEVLAKVGENHPGSAIGEQYGNKSHAQIKAREIVKKHKEKLKK